MRRPSVLVLSLVLAFFLFARAGGEEVRKLVAVPDFALEPAGKILDDEMGVLAASMFVPALQKRFRVLPREELLAFLQKKGYSQRQLLSDNKAIAALKEIGVSLLLMGRIKRIAEGKYRIEALLFDIEKGTIVSQAKKRIIEKTGDLTNACREMSAELVKVTAKTSPSPVPTAAGKTAKPGGADPAAYEKLEVEIHTNKGSFVIRLFPREAPVTVQNFVRLCRAGYYDGKLIHRVIKDFIVQMGASDAAGHGNPGNIPNEFNDHPHVRGAVAMARNVRKGGVSHGAQFYVALKRLEKLDRNFTVFGQVVKGMDVIDAIAAVPVREEDGNPYFPAEKLVILGTEVRETAEPFTPPPMLPPMITLKTKGVIIAEVATSKGTFRMRFYPRKAPKLVANFLDLAQRHFYDGLEWHRVVRDFVIQTGDPDPDDPSFDEAPRPVVREAPSDLKHVKGAVGAAKSSEDTDINSSSQFYICLKDLPFLDGKYAIFAQVYEGMDVVEAIGKVPTDASDRPIDPVYVDKITIINLGDVTPPWEKKAGKGDLVPAAENTPYSKIVAVISTDYGDIKMKFYADKAPRTVANFINLARRGFYDGMYIHRVVRGVLIQMGDPKTNGQTAPPPIPDEFDNGLSHYKGTVAMANRGEPGTATCQFFINLQDNLQYDGKYTVFAEVIEGLEVAEKISRLKVTNVNGEPETKVYFSVKLMTWKE